MVKSLKEILITFFTCVICFGLLCSLSACTNNTNDKISIVCTIFPEYDWVCEVLGDDKDDFDLTLLMNSGTDLHSYQPTVADIAKISTADIFIYVGGESDEWVDNALSNAVNKDMVVINLLSVLGDNAKEEELKEGMQGEEDEADTEETATEEEKEYDEHVWLSLKNAKLFVNAFLNELTKFDIENKEIYEQNASSYINKLELLDSEYQTIVDAGNIKTLIFGDRFPFRYLVDDYELDYYAAFIGCSAESEASFETVTFLARKIDELGVKVILKLESSNGSIANTIKQNTNNKNQEILTLDSMQSTTLKSGKTYLSIMEDNLEVIKKAVR